MAQRSLRRVATWLVVVAVMLTVVVTWRAERERPAPVTTVGEPTRRPAALVVVHPGLSDFQDAVTTAFVRSLASRGWRIDRTTAHGDAPADLASYDLLVLGGPTYYWMPPRPLTRYVRRLGDLRQKPVVLLMTGAGSGDRSLRLLRQIVEEQHGSVRAALMLFVLRPNREDPASMARPNRDVALEMAAEAAQMLTVSRP
jgi:hypothetical protein